MPALEALLKDLKHKDDHRFERGVAALLTGGDAADWDSVLEGVTWSPPNYADLPGELKYSGPLKPRGRSAARTRARVRRLIHLAPEGAEIVDRVRGAATSLEVKSKELVVDLSEFSNWSALKTVRVWDGAPVAGVAPQLTRLDVHTFGSGEEQIGGFIGLESLSAHRVSVGYEAFNRLPALREARFMIGSPEDLLGVEKLAVPSLWIRGRFPEELAIHASVEDLHVLDCQGLHTLTIPDGSVLQRLRQWYAETPTTLDVGALPRLTECYVDPLDHVDLSPLRRASALEILRVGGPRLRSLEGLPDIGRLKELSVSKATIDWSALRAATRLHTLTAGTSNWWDATAIMAGLPGLRVLYLDESNVEDSFALSELHQVEKISMRWCKGFMQLDQLARLEGLKELDLSGSGMTRRDLPPGLVDRVRVTL